MSHQCMPHVCQISMSLGQSDVLNLETVQKTKTNPNSPSPPTDGPCDGCAVAVTVQVLMHSLVHLYGKVHVSIRVVRLCSVRLFALFS